MTAQDLINEARNAKGVHNDGYRQFSSEINGVECEIVTKKDKPRIQFWHYSERISKAEANEILTN